MRVLLVLLSISCMILGRCSTKNTDDVDPSPSSQPAQPSPAPSVKNDGADANAKPGPPNPTPSSAPLEATGSSVQQQFINKFCIGCHSEATSKNRNTNLSNLTALVDDGSPAGTKGLPKKIILAGCAQKSFLLNIVKEKKMPPPPASAVSADTVAILTTWIVSLKSKKPDPCKDDDEPE